MDSNPLDGQGFAPHQYSPFCMCSDCDRRRGAAMSHATPQDTLAALRTRYDAQIEKAVLLALRWEGYRDNEQESDEVRAAWDLALIEGDAVLKGAIRDARLKLALLDQVAAGLADDRATAADWEMGADDAALATLRLLAESAGEAVAW